MANIKHIQLNSNIYDVHDERVDHIRKDFDNAKFVMIGDSFGSATDGWIYQLRTHMGLTQGEDLFSSAIGGTGFDAGSVVNNFKAQITMVANTMTEEQKNSITHVVAVGGTNDMQTDVSGAYVDVIIDFVNKAKELFPEANVYLGFTSTLYREADYTSGRRALASFGKLCMARACMFSGAHYISGLNETINNLWRDIQTDYVHPTTEGYLRLASAIYQGMLGHDIDIPTTKILNTNTYTSSFGLTSHVYYDGNEPFVSMRILAVYPLYNGAAKYFAESTWFQLLEPEQVPNAPTEPMRLLMNCQFRNTSDQDTFRNVTVELSRTNGVRFLFRDGGNITNVKLVTLLGDLVFTFMPD